MNWSGQSRARDPVQPYRGGFHHGPNTTAFHGFVLEDDALTNFDYPGAGVTSTVIFGVNPQGNFVGGFNVGSVSATFQHGYICR